MYKNVHAGMLNVSYLDAGDPAGRPVVLLHGFPYDIHCYDEVVPRLVAGGARVLVPFLRGYGSTSFVSADTLRSGEQAVLGYDLLKFLDALQIPSAVLAGFDWGGRAACVVAALWPERVRGLVSCNGYNIQNIAKSGEPLAPEVEHRYWYQYYFHSQRGQAGLERNRRALCRLLWQMWSPGWLFDDAAFERSAASFDNPDFVAVAIHSYRHRFGLVQGYPAVAGLESRLAAQPQIPVPAVTLEGELDGVNPPLGAEAHAPHFSGRHEYRLLPGVGHNPPQERPEAFAAAVFAAHEAAAV